MESTICIHPKSLKFDLLKNIDSCTVHWNENQVRPTNFFPTDVMKFVHNRVFKDTNFKDEFIMGFICLNWKGNIVRAHPCFKSGEPWHDYTNIKWEGRSGSYECPAKVLLCLDLWTSDITLTEKQMISNIQYMPLSTVLQLKV